MADDILMAMAAAVAGKAAEVVCHGAGESWDHLVGRFRRRLDADPAAPAALARAEAAPDSEAALNKLAGLLGKAAAADPGLAAALGRFSRPEPPGPSQVVNHFDGHASQVIQGGDFHVQGGLWMGSGPGDRRS